MVVHRDPEVLEVGRYQQHVDVVQSQPLKTPIDAGGDVIRRNEKLVVLPGWCQSQLRRHHDLLSGQGLERAAENGFAFHVARGRVEQVHAQVEGSVQKADHLAFRSARLLPEWIVPAGAHPQRGNSQARSSEMAICHGDLLQMMPMPPSGQVTTRRSNGL